MPRWPVLLAFGPPCITIHAIYRRNNLQLDNILPSRRIEASLEVAYVFIPNGAVFEVPAVEAQVQEIYIYI